MPLELGCPCYFARDTEEMLCLLAGAVIFVIPSPYLRGSPPTLGGGPQQKACPNENKVVIQIEREI